MKDAIISKEKINTLVKRALKDYKVIAPINNEGVVLFSTITDPSQMTLNFLNTKIPVKAVLLEQTETLFTFSRGKSITVKSPEGASKILVLGVRPCDAESLAALDHVFADEVGDPYMTKRENTVCVGLTCTTPAVTCFCTSVNGSPFSAEHTDIHLTDIGDSYYVEVKTDKGDSLVESMSDLFSPVTEEHKREKKEVEEKAVNAIQRHMHTDGLVERLDDLFENPYWRNISLKCLGCAACTYVCPTCHCFDMQDETSLTKGARIRVWDSCMCSEYTLHASGYNPRPERMNRVRNRVYHKYNYFPKNCAVIGCVGCGRCIDVCPVNIDIIDVVNKTSEVKP